MNYPSKIVLVCGIAGMVSGVYILILLAWLSLWYAFTGTGDLVACFAGAGGTMIVVALVIGCIAGVVELVRERDEK